MTLKKQFQILAVLFGLCAVFLIVLFLNRDVTRSSITWSINQVFNRPTVQGSLAVPALKDNYSKVIRVGTMVFIEGSNISSDSVVMLNNKMLDRSDYEIATNEAIYFKAPREGAFGLRVVNKAGKSNEINFSVSNSYNINLSYPSSFISSYADLVLMVGTSSIALTPEGQAIVPVGYLNKAPKNAFIEVKGRLRNDSKYTTIGFASIDRTQKIEGAEISPYSTALFLINTMLTDLNQRNIYKRTSEKETYEVAKITEIIRDMTYNSELYDLHSPIIAVELTKSVRNIRKTRKGRN